MPYGPVRQMQFVGVDFGWQSGASGLCHLSWDGAQLHLAELARLQSMESVLGWIDQRVGEQAGAIAVDAPTLIPNQTGMRLPDRLAHKHFGRYHAGCYPANLNRPFAEHTVQFGLSLERRGFLHAPTIDPRQPGRYQMEIFPHPATIHLFGLPQILKYKKGTLAQRFPELMRLRQLCLEHLPKLMPPLKLEAAQLPISEQRGKPMKALEDKLDSLVCAYVAAHWWYWGTEKNWVLGDRDRGYIIGPAPVYGSD
ncbi:MAG: DUF429 domain-containing protein [Cyanobacteria bacterium P01_D01_bin.128]